MKQRLGGSEIDRHGTGLPLAIVIVAATGIAKPELPCTGASVSARSATKEKFLRPSLALIDLPPVWLALHIAVAWVLSLVSPPVFGGFGMTVGGWLIGSGILITLLAAAQMALARTTVIPRRNPSSLVTSGLFALSRNPIYLSDLVILLGAILWLDAVLALPLLPGFAWLIQTRFIYDEEVRLTAAFGPEFDLWAARTRRWIGWRW
jgi:protein-S-isoprenylcysteine O-methyltransferase Ste14